MSNVYFISDLHFGHKRICEFSGPQRGNSTTVEEHDTWIISQWNSVVTKRDVVWILGDVCFDKKKLHLIKKLNGQKNLILGNHDDFGLETYKPYFNKIHGFMKYNGFWLSHAPIHPNELRGRMNIHGHVHHKTIPDDRYVNVSVEALNGIPICITELYKRKNLLKAYNSNKA